MQPSKSQSTAQSTSDWLRRLWATVFGLQTKATALVVCLMLLTAGAMYGLSMQTAWKLTNRLEREQALQQAVLVANLAAQVERQGDDAALQRLAAELANGDPLEFVIITDTDGRILASAGRTIGIPNGDRLTIERPGASLGTPVAARRQGSESTYLDLTYPIMNRSPHRERNTDEKAELLGYARIGVNRDRTLAEFAAARDLVTGVGIAIVLLAVPLGFFVVRRIVVPINELSSVAGRFSAGELGARSSVKRADEIGALANSFNDMADQVARKHQEILTLNDELESRVLERTSQLRELAARDPLTGLHNRRHFSEVLAHQFAAARRYRNELSILMIDIDDFKAVNDRFGHPVGDEILILLAMIIAEQLRAADVAARFGGDEFIILLPQSDASHAQALASRIVERFEHERGAQFPKTDISLSIGIASLDELKIEIDEELVRQADRAMYQAKAQGKNRIAQAAASAQ